MDREVPEENLSSLTFGLGVNNIDSEKDLPEGSAKSAVNVDITRSGWPRRRKGYTKQISLSNGHSLFSNGKVNMLVSGGSLSTFDDYDFALTPISTSLDRMAYADDKINSVYCTDGTTIGRVSYDGLYNSAWIDNPAGNPTVAASSLGSIQLGKYMVAITYVTSDGEESGTDISVPVELTTGGGIHVTEIPQNSDASYTRLYISSTGGENFYRQIDIPMGITTYTLTSFVLGKELETQFAEPMPAGSVLCYHYGRLYISVGDYIYYSEPLRPGLTRLMDNYFPVLGGEIKLMMPHTTGIFIVANQTHFLSGTNPEQMTPKMVYPHSGVKGTGVNVPSSIVGIEYPGDTPMWFSDNGLVAGTAEGQIVPVTEKQLSVDKYDEGAALFREENGIRSVVTALQAKSVTARLATSDSISFEIRRNGISI